MEDQKSVSVLHPSASVQSFRVMVALLALCAALLENLNYSHLSWTEINGSVTSHPAQELVVLQTGLFSFFKLLLFSHLP